MKVEEELLDKEWQKFQRLQKAKRNKELLLKKLESKERKKPLEWILKKKEMWRKYRMKEQLEDQDWEEVQKALVASVPERPLSYKKDREAPEFTGLDMTSQCDKTREHLKCSIAPAFLEYPSVTPSNTSPQKLT